MPRVKVWTTARGERIPIRDMGDVHLRNCIALIARAHRAYLEHAEPHVFNGEMAQYYAERDWAMLRDSSPGEVWPVYDDLVDELERRERRERRA